MTSQKFVGAPRAAWQGAKGLEAPSGAALYAERCASCHGATATGDGPMSRALKHVPPDLTTLSLKNNGMFPSARVYRIIEGRGGDSIEAIVKFLESIRRRQA